MRVVSGTYKGRRFHPPKKFPSRPTTDFAKEALFNILENRFDLSSCNVLDLYAGTGNISLEFLSRGATNVLSVDKHPVSYRFIQKMIAEIGDENWQTIRRDALAFCRKSDKTYDLIFADPPFGTKDLDGLITQVFEGDLLAKNGQLIIEHGQEFEGKGTHFVEIRKYGGVCFSFYGRPDEYA